jgi:hypothetical protein
MEDMRYVLKAVEKWVVGGKGIRKSNGRDLNRPK